MAGLLPLDQVVQACAAGNTEVLADVRRIADDAAYTPADPSELAGAPPVPVALVSFATQAG